MRFADQHIHTACSPDSETPMREMAEAAKSHGMSAVCFTDHVDMDNAETGKNDPSYPACWQNNRDTALEVKANPPEGLEVRFGMELGEANHNPELALKAASHPELDFILGSLHNLKDVPDFYWYSYQSEEECEKMNRLYLQELIELADFPGFDVMAHVGYTSRYMRRKGFRTRLTLKGHEEGYEELLKKLIGQGRGVEVNCEGFRENDTSYPTEEVLRLYKDLGGEIITVGSDGHNAAAASIGIKEGYALLESIGFRYVAEFVKRKPIFYKIG